MGTEWTPRERLIAEVAVLRALVVVRETAEPGFEVVDAAWKAAEAYVAALEAEPEKVVECPCCTKLVGFCPKHYELHEPGKPCVDCRRDG